MEFDDNQAPGKISVMPGQSMHQPGMVLDSQPGSEISADQISIDLSEDANESQKEIMRLDSAPSPRIVEAKNDDDDDDDCNLSDAKFKSNPAKRQTPIGVIAAGVPYKANQHDGKEVNVEDYKSEEQPQAQGSPEPRNYRNSVLQHQESDTKLMKRNEVDSFSKLVERDDPLRQSASTATVSRFNGGGGSHRGTAAVGAIQEELKEDLNDPAAAQKYNTNVYEMNAKRQTELMFSKKLSMGDPQSIEMKERANSVNVLIRDQPQNDERLSKSKNGENLAHSGKQDQMALGGEGNDLQHIAKLPKNVEHFDESTIGLVKNPICRRFFTLFRVLGTLLCAASLVCDFMYTFMTTFSSKELLVFCIAILGLRVLNPMLVILKNLCSKVCSKDKNSLPAAMVYSDHNNEEDLTVEDQQKQHTRLGYLLYTALPFHYMTGSYRLLNFKNFPREIGTGIALDFVFYALPMLFVQTNNNATLFQLTNRNSSALFQLNNIQAFAMVTKLALLLELVLELVMFIYELIKLHHLERQSINVVIRYSEQDRRRKFAKKYCCRAAAWFSAILLSCVACYLLLDSVLCTDDQAVEWNSVCYNCEMEHCERCREAGKDGCSRCELGYYFDQETGLCEDASCRVRHCDSCDSSGIWGCDRCIEGYYYNKLLGVCRSAACQVDYCDVCDLRGPNLCDICIDGYVYDFETGRCEDLTCKVDLCEDCSIAGIHGCDRCKAGYYFDVWDLECLDLTCKVPQCDVCDDNPRECQKCINRYWLDESQNTCVDGTCLIDECSDCSISGPTRCDTCREGFEFNVDLNICEDKRCLLSNCDDCSIRGINRCDRCAEGFFYDQDEKECIDSSCQVPQCETCETHPSTCEDCVKNYWLQTSTNTCIDATCLVENCNQCSVQGPSKCDQCIEGYAFNAETGLCEDIVCKVALCDDCSESGIWECDTCAIGYYFDIIEGECLDLSCKVKQCEVCDANPRECEQCVKNYWLDPTGACIDGTCLIEFCQDCSVGGPTTCQQCLEGFEWNEEKNECFDARCLLEYCEDCSKMGAYGCDRCSEGRYFDIIEGKCLDMSCKVPQCETCETHPRKCDSCVQNYWLDLDENVCIDATCQVENCSKCDQFGPSYCNKCQLGYYWKDNTCLDCDTNPQVIICQNCVNPDYCYTCSYGFNLSNNKCTECDTTKCESCSQQNGRCRRCRPGYYLNAMDGNCYDCDEGCLECGGPGACSKCDSNIHQQVYPDDNQCKCDAVRGWQSTSSTGYGCQCGREFLTMDNQCVSCGEHFPDCAQCSRVEDSKIGLKVQSNPLIPAIVAGTYQCTSCINEYYFFNHVSNECQTCSSQHTGCQKCYGDADVCSDCKTRYGFTDASRPSKCLSCTKYDSECQECNSTKCTKCTPGHGLGKWGAVCGDCIFGC